MIPSHIPAFSDVHRTDDKSRNEQQKSLLLCHVASQVLEAAAHAVSRGKKLVEETRRLRMAAQQLRKAR